MKFIATCVSGLQDVAATTLEAEGFAGFRLAETEDGLVAFETGRFPSSLGSLRYLNNVFEVVAQHRLGPGQTIDGFVRWLISQSHWHAAIKRSAGPQERTYRLMLSEANELVAGDKSALSHLMKLIETATGLKLKGRGADAEFWAITRSGGNSYLCKRVARHDSAADLPAGALKSELATLLCLLAEPNPSDIFLDPFAGSGAIPAARARMPYNMIFASDTDSTKMEYLKQRSRNGEIKLRKNSPFIVRTADATALERIEDGFIDTVVTDPPWGHYEKLQGDAEEFYASVLRELIRVVKSGGMIVMLLGDRQLTDDLSRKFSYVLAETARHEILVSGKKAVAVRWKRA